MEHKFLSGVSVFDFLTMVIPGGLILAMGANFLGEIPLVIDLCEKCKFSWYIVILVSSYYLLGLINNTLMDFVFKWFRNNPFYILTQYQKICATLPNIGVLGQLNMPSNIEVIVKKNEEGNKIISGYYMAYYFVATKQINSSISIMECQVAFVRNLILLVFLMGICGKVNVIKICFEVDICWWVYIVASLCLFVVMFTRQNKIYRRVFEDYVYLKIKR